MPSSVLKFHHFDLEAELGWNFRGTSSELPTSSVAVLDTAGTSLSTLANGNKASRDAIDVSRPLFITHKLRHSRRLLTTHKLRHHPYPPFSQEQPSQIDCIESLFKRKFSPTRSSNARLSFERRLRSLLATRFFRGLATRSTEMEPVPLIDKCSSE
jgi:hypothetical protein